MSLVTRIVFAGSLALSTAGLLLAQHSGGHGSGGHGGGGSFGRGAAASGYGGQAFAAPPIGTMNAVPPGASSRFSAPSIGTMNAVPPGRARLGYTGGRYSSGRGSGNNYRNRNYPLGYWFTPYYYPGLFYDSGPLFDFYDNYPYPVGDVAQSPEAQQQDLAQNMPPQYAPYPPYYYPQEPYAVPPQGAYAAPPPGYYYNAPYATNPAAAAPQTSQTQPAPPVTLILTNGEKVQVQNYAIMGSTFWDFSKQPARRIPLSSIDIPASTKATEANGAEFPPIS
jgi:hypothetical protein